MYTTHSVPHRGTILYEAEMITGEQRMLEADEQLSDLLWPQRLQRPINMWLEHCCLPSMQLLLLLLLLLPLLPPAPVRATFFHRFQVWQFLQLWGNIGRSRCTTMGSFGDDQDPIISTMADDGYTDDAITALPAGCQVWHVFKVIKPTC